MKPQSSFSDKLELTEKCSKKGAKFVTIKQVLKCKRVQVQQSMCTLRCVDKVRILITGPTDDDWTYLNVS